MQLPNHRQGKLDILSQHAIDTNHRSGSSDTLSQHTQCRQAIPACTVKLKLYKRGCKSPEQWASWHSEMAVQLEQTYTRRGRRASSYNTLGGWARGVMHWTTSAELGIEGQWTKYKLEPVPCYYFSTTEGEPELHPYKGTIHSAPLHWCHDERPHSGTIPKWYRPALNWPWGEYPVSFMPSSQGKNKLHLKICLPLLLPSKWFYHITITVSLCTCQLVALQECIHHSRPCSGRLETDIKLIVPHIKCTQWLPAMEVQDAPWTEALISRTYRYWQWKHP